MNICKQYTWYNESSENLYNNLNQGSYKKIKELLNPQCLMKFKKYKPTLLQQSLGTSGKMLLGIPCDCFWKGLNFYSGGLSVGFVTIYLQILCGQHAI